MATTSVTMATTTVTCLTTTQLTNSGLAANVRVAEPFSAVEKVTLWKTRPSLDVVVRRGLGGTVFCLEDTSTDTPLSGALPMLAVCGVLSVCLSTTMYCTPGS